MNWERSKTGLPTRKGELRQKSKWRTFRIPPKTDFNICAVDLADRTPDSLLGGHYSAPSVETSQPATLPLLMRKAGVQYLVPALHCNLQMSWRIGDLNATSIRNQIREFIRRNLLNTHGNPQEHGKNNTKENNNIVVAELWGTTESREAILMKNTPPTHKKTNMNP